MVATTLNPAQSRAGYFYVSMAFAFALIAFGGFAGTYWLQVPAGTFVGPPLLHLHAGLMSAWCFLLIGQTWQAAQGRLENHRAWGVVGVSLATAIVIVGIATALHSMAHGLASGYGDRSRAFFIVPVTAVTTFAVLFAAAVANVSRPDWHKRLMLAATASLVQAAVARFFFLAATGGGPGARPGLGPPLPVAFAMGPALLATAVLLAGVAYDWRTRGRPHPAYGVGIGVLVLVALVRIPLSASPQWLAFADFMHRFAS